MSAENQQQAGGSGRSPQRNGVVKGWLEVWVEATAARSAAGAAPDEPIADKCATGTPFGRGGGWITWNGRHVPRANNHAIASRFAALLSPALCNRDTDRKRPPKTGRYVY